MGKKFYVNIDAGIDWYNVNVAIVGTGIEKVNREKLGMHIFGQYSKKELNASKMSLFQNKKQIPTLEQWLLILEFFTPDKLTASEAWGIKKTIQETLICYYD